MRTVLVLSLVTAVALAGGADQAQKLLAKKEYAKAEAAARKLAEADAANVDAWLVLADAMVGQADSLEGWEQQGKDARIPINLATIRSLVDLGTRFDPARDREEYEAAAERYRALLNDHPGLGLDDRVLFKLGDCYEALRRTDEADRIFRTLVVHYQKSRYAFEAKKRLAANLE